MSRQVVTSLMIERLSWWASAQADKTACSFLADGKQVSGSLSYAELDQRARIVAEQVRAHGAEGAPVLILCPAGLDYVSALLGCFRAGAIAVPAYPPTRTGIARTLPRIRSICRDCDPKAVLTTSAVREVLASEPELGEVLARAAVIELDAVPPAGDLDGTATTPSPDAPALLQYTSGSTSDPKGVLITHAQLAANLALINACGLSRADTLLSWLPPYHDMGLIGGILAPLYVGAHTVLMPPDVFLRRPRRWLECVAEFRATVLVTPNFALDTCVRRLSDDDRASLDLSSVQQVYVGAEPVRAQTLERFSQVFASCGFRREALYPCYGMAEATLVVSGGDRAAPPVVHAVESILAEDEAARCGVATSEPFVGCGRALSGTRIRIVDPETRSQLDDGRVGEIWVQTPSAASQYWRNTEATERTFQGFTRAGEGPFLRTGDLGLLSNGELYVTGRLKDVIIVRGRNHYPQDIERTVQSLDDALVLDAGAAFAATIEGVEQLVVVQEVDKRTGVDPGALIQRIPAAVFEQHEIAPTAIVLIKRGSLPKTSSGKVQRSATRNAWLEGTLTIAAQIKLGGTGPRPNTEPRGPRRTQHEIEAWLRERVASKVGLQPDALDPSEPVARYGVDSALAAEIIEELQQWIELRLDTTISYDHPTIAGLARAVASMKARTSPSMVPHARSSEARVVRPAQSANRDAIAIVGMACRFPGAPDLDRYWDLLEQGRDAVTKVPSERWDADALYDPSPEVPGKSCSKWGGFIEGIERFDAAFFGISSHEAASMDPQQRLFLEVAWTALEDAGQSPTALAGSRSGVFAGVCSSDFASLYAGDLGLVDAEYGTGSSASLVANRLSYVLDLHGPSETVDSACSSSLVALQHACQSLTQGDCDLAVVGGVNAVLAPEVGISLSRLGVLARDGHCKAFDHRADGFVRSEGAGVIVLKRLSSAVAARDHVYALVSACAVNHDGRSNGLTAPSGPAQREVLARALEIAQVTAKEIDYVEAHGVGAPIADAVELKALGAVLGTPDRTSSLLVGSVKTNLGHLEAASGIASVIKVALSLARERIPPQIHFERTMDGVELQPLHIDILNHQVPWLRGARPRLAGVSAFGFGGSNAHAILREAPAPLPSVLEALPAAPAPQLLTLAARTPTALAASVRNLSDHLEHARASLEDICFTANVGRAALPERAAFLARDIDELRERLLSVALGAHGHGAFRGSCKSGSRPRVGFAFTDGPVDIRVLRELWSAHPLLTQALDLSQQIVRGQRDIGLRELLALDDQEANARLAKPSFAHAASVAVQHALTLFFDALGIEPVAVYGRGLGEHAAAAASGALQWDTALELATQRGILREGLREGGAQKLTLRDAKLAIAHAEQAMVAPQLPLVSELLGAVFGLGERPEPAHWTRHLLAAEPEQSQASAALLAQGAIMHIELGTASGVQQLTGLPDDAWLVALRDGQPVLESLLIVLSRLYVGGANVRWEKLYESSFARKVSLPTYPFERERHWLDFPVREQPQARPLSERASAHPLVSRMRVSDPASQSGFIRKGHTGKVSGDS